MLSGFRIPQLFVHSLFLLGHASGGVALFACGIVLASGKIIVNRNVLLFVFLKNIMQEVVQKFDTLVAGRIDDGLSGEIKNAVRSVENIQVRDLMKLLGSIRVASKTTSSSKAA